MINLPIKDVSDDVKAQYSKFAELLTIYNNDFQSQSLKFQRAIQRKFGLDDLPKKLQEWYLLNYTEFIKELNKRKVKLSLAQEAEWEDYFVEESNKVIELKATINMAEVAINRMIYNLYELNEKEIEIVEGS